MTKKLAPPTVQSEELYKNDCPSSAFSANGYDIGDHISITWRWQGKCDRLILSASFKFFDRETPLSDCDNISAYEKKKDNCKLKQLAIITD